MFISPIGLSVHYAGNKNNLSTKKLTSNQDTFSKSQISFKGEPWELNQSRRESITADEAIDCFDELKLGNYLDIDGNPNSYKNRRIRTYNLAFLDKLTHKKDKKAFISHYKNITGFPNLSVVSNNIEQEFVSAVRKTEKKLMKQDPKFKVLAFGYDGISSAAKNRALPGSDLNNAFIVIEGSNDTEADRELVEKFKAELWKNTDQRILSYNRTAHSFPKIYTNSQFRKLITAFANAVNEKDLEGTAMYLIPFMGYVHEMLERKRYRKYYDKCNTFDTDYVNANKFFIDISSRFPVRGHWRMDFDNPSKENMYELALVLEAAMKGKEFAHEPDMCIYNAYQGGNFLNLSQIKSLSKLPNGNKPKYQKRAQLQQIFQQWPEEKQLRFIKEMIKASCSDSDEFTEYFSFDDEIARYSKLKQALGIK